MQYSKIRRFVIVDKHSPQKLMRGYWYSDTPFFRSGRRKFLALQGLIRRSRRSIGDSGVSGAASAVPAYRRWFGVPGVTGALTAVSVFPALNWLFRRSRYPERSNQCNH